MAIHNELGRWGEDYAADFLAAQGYRIVERNWRFGHHDIDIIASKGNEIVFVEVKTRRSNAYIEPETAVDYRKMLSIRRAANNYIKKYDIEQMVRFDIVAICKNEGKDATLNHIEDAFGAF